ncbi:YgfZ/GcvT domain-containing protein [Ancylobacter oerskovii]|uniref:YgfZ/GcvT domain-containing protein n=1 Tax=Ancylobacter oerskovii TaxID=459519 RepID=A0ABW4YUD9_9HYPH|nr:folate-binding protein [Ancylobacter oerskovii]MBS7544531.1 folate-binding protein YgfZ [Ancylobacter oerskovii]
MPIALFGQRALARIDGADAAHFLDNLLTARTPAPGTARYAALLTPQGKIIADMFVYAVEEGFRLDVPADRLPDLLKRLTLYRLRAKVEIAALEGWRVGIAWNGAEPPAGVAAFADPRLPALGIRFLLPPGVAVAEDADEAAWQAHRVALGVPEGGRDFAYADAFPHEADMDQLHGIDFDKGCYVGQEIVSRMQHRGTARTRVVPFAVCGPAPAPGTAILAGGKTLGTVGSGVEGRVLALIRLDRLAEARESGLAIEADGVTLVPERLDWASFAIPGTGSAA